MITYLSNFSVGASPRREAPSVTINWLNRHLPDPQDQREYAKERCVVSVTDAIHGALEVAGLSQVEVAERIGKSKSFVSRALNGGQNMTLHTLGDLLWACNVEVRGLETGALGEVEVAWQDAIAFYEGGHGTGPSPPVDAAPEAATVVYLRTSAANLNYLPS